MAALWTLLLTLTASLRPGDVRAQAGGALLITELYYDTPGDDSREEWFELTNTGATAVALDDHKIGDEETPGGGEGMVTFPDDVRLEAGQSIVIAQTTGGFRALFGRAPDYELKDEDPAVPDLVPYASWAGGEMAFNNDGDELLLVGPDDELLDAVSYGESTLFMQPSVPDITGGQSIERIPAYCDRDTASDWHPQPSPTPGYAQLVGDCPAPAATMAEQLLAIGEIQGRGPRSPRINETVTFEGIITGMLQDRNTRGAIFYTLFVQELPGREDGDPRTSDGIAVFHGPRRPNFLPGDIVRVTGQVTEFYGFTEIDDSGLRIELLASAQPLPAAVPLAPPQAGSQDYFEALEAMRVILPEAVVVGPTYESCGFAVVPGSEPRLYVRQQLSDPAGEIVPVLHTSDISCGDFPQVKRGDRLQNIAGPLVYHFDQFKIVLQESGAAVISPAPPPSAPAPPALDGEISVTTFNLHDFFDAVDDTGSDAEPKPSPDEVLRKQAKLAGTIATALNCPTILAVQEVEKLALLEGLAQALEGHCAFRYGLAHQESADARGIDLGLMVDPRRAQILSVSARQRCAAVATALPEVDITCPPGQDPIFSRPPLQVSLLVDGEPVTVVVTHFKSKREGEDETRARRLAQATAVAQMVQDEMRANPAALLIVMGDFNDYELSQPMEILTSADTRMVNTASQVPIESRYTYNFGGVSQLLDGILLSPALAERVALSQIIHVNADFPAAWAVDANNLFRSSDHDIPLVVLSSATGRTSQNGEEQAAEVPTVTPNPTPHASEVAASAPTSDTPAIKRTTGSGRLLSLAGLALLAVGVGVVAHHRRSRR